mgnify:CR=1 FL=1
MNRWNKMAAAGLLATLRGWALGGAEFVAELHGKTARRAAKATAGRPKMDKKSKEN